MRLCPGCQTLVVVLTPRRRIREYFFVGFCVAFEFCWFRGINESFGDEHVNDGPEPERTRTTHVTHERTATPRGMESLPLDLLAKVVGHCAAGPSRARSLQLNLSRFVPLGDLSTPAPAPAPAHLGDLSTPDLGDRLFI